ncbi:MAG: dynamin family protein [Opitutales bacterium]
MSVEPIRVELESFCQQFTTALEPFNEALEQGTGALREAMQDASLQAPLGDLQDNRHRLKILLDKARQQNTYLVIFGPLKSGKSTLMNAISGAYVSEVTSLPAYPCLVYVKEGESHGFSTTAFNGDRSEYASREELHSSLQNAHRTLAGKLREADAAGRSFNPAQDFTEAIRRIDFTMPAPYLRESGTILVDTPGLYTKMKYSYGQLTRDFRDTAACAVFVVKTDNLFFEQVFEEFADLLDVFSRVFLVVNIDSSKQDLGPDGRLEPSLEKRDPKQIIEAFENLTVSAQMRDAIDSGRLRIYMIDLLQTAAQSLRAGDPLPQSAAPGSDAVGEDEDAADEPGDAGESGDAASAPEEVPVQTEAGPRLGFEHFLTDLTDYLNSSEYIAEFMADSLRQADSILREVGDRARAPEIIEFRASIEALEAQVEATERRLQTLDELRRYEWSAPLEALTEEIRQQVTEHSGSVLPELERELQSEVEAWSESDESMRDLVEDRIGSKISEACRRSRARAIEIFHLVCRDRNGGVQIGEEVGRQLQALELSFDDIYSNFQATVRENFEPAPELPDASGLQDEIPLRRRFLDWIFFRSDARVRQGVFGPENPSGRPFPAKAKARRFNEAGIRDFCGLVGDYARRCNLVTLQEVLENLLREYREAFIADARQRIEARREVLIAEYDETKRELELRHQVLDALGSLETASTELETRVSELQARFLPGKALIPADPAEDELEADPEFPDDADDQEGDSD